MRACLKALLGKKEWRVSSLTQIALWIEVVNLLWESALLTSSIIHSQLYAVCDVIWKQVRPSSSVGMVCVSSFRSVNIILILPEFLCNSGKENIVLPDSCHQRNNRLKLLLPYFWTLLPFYLPLKSEAEIHHSHMRCVYRPGALCVLTRGTCVLYLSCFGILWWQELNSAFIKKWVWAPVIFLN